ncbi:MAG: hypothetical protein K6F57_03820 [Candidatus Saccharibacteria bacterium]|nr:hypothetical protein [Candidatus Saccharibacteria bacterium]
MRVVIIWRDESDYGRTVTEWLHDCERRIGVAPESLSPDEPEGESICRAYDIVEYPSMLAIDDGGKVMQMWRGRDLPRIDDVAYYLMEH